MDGSGLAESAGGPDLAVVNEITAGADLEAAAPDYTNGALEPRGMNLLGVEPDPLALPSLVTNEVTPDEVLMVLLVCHPPHVDLRSRDTADAEELRRAPSRVEVGRPWERRCDHAEPGMIMRIDRWKGRKPLLLDQVVHADEDVAQQDGVERWLGNIRDDEQFFFFGNKDRHDERAKGLLVGGLSSWWLVTTGPRTRKTSTPRSTNLR